MLTLEQEPVKYTDAHFAHISDLIIKDWSPFLTAQANLSLCGVAIPTGRELAFNRYAGPVVNLTLYEWNPAVRSLVFLDGPSKWNSRLVLLSGQAVLISNSSGLNQEDFVPRGSLVTMWTWAQDHLLMDVSERSKLFWCNTIFFPTGFFLVNFRSKLCKESLVLALIPSRLSLTSGKGYWGVKNQM